MGMETNDMDIRLSKVEVTNKIENEKNSNDNKHKGRQNPELLAKQKTGEKGLTK